MLKTLNLTCHIENQPLIQKTSLSFLPGQLYGLMGANGAGKSTLLKLLAGIQSPSEGSVYFQEENLRDKDRKWISSRISFMGENLFIPYAFTAYEIVQMGCYFSKKAREKEWIYARLEDVHATHLSARIFHTLSAGEQQRVLIAQALATGASTLLFDEPTSHLDIYHSREIWGHLKLLSQKGKTIIASTHDFEGVKQFCTQTLLISQTLILGPGNFSDILNPATFEKSFFTRQLTP
ncbi:ABC transporter ATP-binding protein [Parachlamydia sp. AcF125]|uniref:ABC transporter ATP-binding protein n=1 Tax=Parachlamydia sp. AcF125 TaxID=2795736 RepID=UPI001BC9970F|nr:ABC transporter ATP-binding protein [Parachlamydia sp. AcF125]MBS4169019.1 Fe(3+) dicitrate transport ATP-binding protein FecE [Parachlamydia sp. AcF125]